MPDKYPLPKIAGHLPLINLKNAASILKHPEVPNAKPSNKPPQAAADDLYPEDFILVESLKREEFPVDTTDEKDKQMRRIELLEEQNSEMLQLIRKLSASHSELQRAHENLVQDLVYSTEPKKARERFILSAARF